MRWLSLILILAFNSQAWSAELREYYKNTRVLGMGNAYVALADDEASIFMNPAGLAGQQQLKINYAAVDFELSADTVMTYLENSSALTGGFNANTINTYMGKNVYARAQVTPTIVMSNFGLGIMVDDQVAMLAKNRNMPQVTMGYQFTNGFQLGWGTSVLKGRSRQKHDLRIGAAAKMLWRRGGYKLISLQQLMNVDSNFLNTVGGEYERGYGFDLGLQYVRHVTPKFSLSWGFVATDIGDTKFGLNSDPIQNNVAMGFGVGYDVKAVKARLAWDFRHLAQTADSKKKMHLGLELALPLISVYGGLYQSSLAYGAAFDLWLFRLTFASYSEERGTLMGEDTERRYALRLALKVGL